MSNPNAPLFIIPGFISIVTVAYFVGTYNNFIKYRNRIEESWSSIDIALKRRVNLIPNLVEVVRGYEEHETELLQKVSHRFSENRDAPTRMEEESKLSRSLHGLMAVAEGYPDLKASDNFLSLQQNLNEIEKEIQLTRNRYNAEVRKYNTLVESFPSLFIARKFGFTKRNYFTLELASEVDPLRVDFSDKSPAQAS
ncbi:MAG: LemA family protein [Desulfobulbaceae bacterium]|nr:LemA family protein [Desulfobulbaceae bacterium]